MASAAFGALPFKEQIAFFERKLNLPTHSWIDIYAAEHEWAFTVAGASKEDIVADFRTAVDKAIRDGTTLETFRKDFDTIVAKHGWAYNGGRNWRSKVIYDTNLATSRAAGRWQQLQDAPYWEYEHSDQVEHPRPQHQAWNGLILARDDPFWQQHFPPNGWGCQCMVRGRWSRDLEKMGKTGPDPSPAVKLVPHTIGKNSPQGPRVVHVPEGIDPGFEYAPGSAQQRQAAQQTMAQRAAPVAPQATPPYHPWHATLGQTGERVWHDAAFGLSPAWLQRQVAQRGALKGGVSTNRNETSLYYIQGDRLNVNPATHGEMSSVLGQGLWRHEYGHAMDYTLQGDGVPRSSEPDFAQAMRSDALDLIAMGGRGKPGDKTLAAIDRLHAAEAQSAQELSASPDRQQWLQTRYATQGLDFVFLQDAMRRHTHFADTLTGAELDERYRRIIIALEMRDAEGLLAAMTGSRYAEQSLTYEKGNLGSLSDLFGSATRNQVAGLRSGYGHSDVYYALNASELPQSESFANLTSLFGDGSPIWARILEIMVPRMAQLFKEIMH